VAGSWERGSKHRFTKPTVLQNPLAFNAKYTDGTQKESGK
jgi:hypothetical protein